MSVGRLLLYRDMKHSCARKHPHRSKGTAEAHIRALKKLHPEEEMVAYACRYCPNWHVAHKKV